MNKQRAVLLGYEERTREGVYVDQKIRSTHLHVLGTTGSGKSKFMEHLIREDILNNNGLCLIDPHGYLYGDIVKWCETKRFLGRKKILLFDPTEEGLVFSFNPLQVSSSTTVSFHVDAMVKAVAKVWGGEDQDKTPTLKRCLRVIFHILAEKKLSLLEAQHLIRPTNSELREYISANIQDQVIMDQWDQFSGLNERQFSETFSSTVNRMTEFFSSSIIRNIIGQTERTINFRKIMDEGYVLLVNLAAKSRLSDDNARLLGTLIVNDLFVNARGRPAGSNPFYLYIDECARYINEDVGRILDEGRKFGLHLILAHQHLSQLKKAGEEVYSSVMTCANTKVVFGGLTAEDAEIMSKEIFLDINMEEPKRSMNKPVVVGYEKILMKNISRSTSRTEGESDGFSDGSSNSESKNERDDTINNTSGGSQSNTKAYNSSYADGESEGHSEALMPILKNMPTQTYSLEEQRYKAVSLMKKQPTQHAIVKMPGQGARFIKVPTVNPGFANDKRVEEYKKECYLLADFVKTEEEAKEHLDKRIMELKRSAEGNINALPNGDPKGFRDSAQPKIDR